MAEFTGFPLWGPQFYDELERNNDREFWAANKERWERDVRDPMRALVAVLEPEFGPATVFRPYRDLRFSPDKSPYKLHQGAIAGPAPGFGYYVGLDADGLIVGGGFRTHSPAQTDRFRKAIDADDGDILPAIADALVEQGYMLDGAALKTRPRGYPADHPRIDLLRRKELMAVTNVGTPPWLPTPAALDHVREMWRQIRPLAQWVVTNVGPD
ncbi:DUF2461 domain-containing protein [Georgenia yuyongxinii]|uniref:DUF2461 domain-containing protein n=1 Tax=Georgenia yuyongxinii TaxID=2589797 RepID=A0A5B8C7I7_9MICO|nr:DUF2461 domain-containing protein [Georgenia yuyongxinii]QDC25132.1 DUF2461 domain-containing protein [Georgenia yuyongxinii]